jgi:hypothetical protein
VILADELVSRPMADIAHCAGGRDGIGVNPWLVAEFPPSSLRSGQTNPTSDGSQKLADSSRRGLL